MTEELKSVFHARRKFLVRLWLCIGVVWVFTSLTIHGATEHGFPSWLTALYVAPLWAVIGAIYAEDWYRRRDAERN